MNKRLYRHIALLLLVLPYCLQAQSTPVISVQDSPHFVSDMAYHSFNVRIDDSPGVFAFSVKLTYDPTAITVIVAYSNNFLGTTGAGTAGGLDTGTPGEIILDEAILGVDPEMTVGGTLFTVVYQAVQNGVRKEVPLVFASCQLRDEMNNPITCDTDDGMIYLWPTRVRAKVYLQGPFVTSSGDMHTQLRDADYTAQQTSPYTQDPVVYGQQLPDNVVDWVLLELRSTATGTILASRSAFLRDDGHIVYPDASASNDLPMDVNPGNYYLIVRHRNHLGVQSSGTHAVGTSAATVYDFTTGQAQAYGTNAMYQLSSSEYGMRAGDGDSNARINATDRAIWNLQNGTIGYRESDYDLSGRVNFTDIVAGWSPNNGTISQIP